MIYRELEEANDPTIKTCLFAQLLLSEWFFINQ